MANIFTVKLPDIGEGVVEGEVIEWLKKENDLVTQDEPVVVVMTDKATVELPAPYPGKIAKHYYKPGQMAFVHKPLYDIETDDVVPTSIAEPENVETKEVSKPAEKSTPSKSGAKPASGNQALATPHTRQLAKELGIDINQIQGTGKEGRVTIEDLQGIGASAGQTPSKPIPRFPGDQETPIIGIKKLMAQSMAESKSKIPHFSFFEQVDATRLVQLRQKFKEEAEKQHIHVTFMPFIIRAVSLSLKKYPQFNSSIDTVENMLVVHHPHNIGIAVSTPLGLIVPVLKNVQEMSLEGIIKAYEDLKERAMTNKLQPHEMKDATITISNFGVVGGGGSWATPVINYPEVSILAVNRIQKQPIARNGVLVVRDILNLSWSFDHRVIDGEMASIFSHYVANLLQNPAPLL